MHVDTTAKTSFSGHCWRNKCEMTSDTILWQPTHGERKR